VRATELRALALGLAAAVVILARAPSVPPYDYCTYHAAGRLFAEGSPAAVYDLAALRARHQRLDDEGHSIGPFFYSPLYLLPARALASLPLVEAARWNRWLGAASLGLGLACLLWRLQRGWEQAAVAAAFVVAHPVWMQLVYQNWTFLAFALLAAAALALARGREAPAAVAWALAIHLKAFFGVALLALVVAGRRRLAARAAAVAILLAALALPATGSESWRRWGSNLVRAESRGVTPFYNKVSLAASVARLGTAPEEWIQPRGGVRSPLVRALFWLALPALAFGLWRSREDAQTAIAFGYAWVLLAVPQIWDHTEIVLFLALPALVPRYRWLLIGLLAATAGYNALLRPMLLAAAQGLYAAAGARLFLWLYPLLNLLTAAALLASRPDAAAPRRSPAPAPETAA